MDTLDLSDQKEDGKAGQYIEEYKILRQEIMHYMEKDATLCSQMYTIVATILSLAFTVKNRNVCLAAFCVIIPVSYKLVYSKERTAKLSSYMHCFLEGQIPGFCWESRVSALRREKEKTSKSKLRFHNVECVSMAFLCSAMYLYMLSNEKFAGRNETDVLCNLGTAIEVLFPIALLLWVVLVTLKRDEFSNMQADWENKWENLKKEEIENE